MARIDEVSMAQTGQGWLGELEEARRNRSGGPWMVPVINKVRSRKVFCVSCLLAET